MTTAHKPLPRSGPSIAARTRADDRPAMTVVVLRLYIASNAPNSVQAVANLEAICREHLKGGFELEIVDVLEYPRRALADGVFVTPSLAKVSPSPVARVIGNLGDKAGVLRALGIRG